MSEAPESSLQDIWKPAPTDKPEFGSALLLPSPVSMPGDGLCSNGYLRGSIKLDCIAAHALGRQNSLIDIRKHGRLVKPFFDSWNPMFRFRYEHTSQSA